MSEFLLQAKVTPSLWTEMFQISTFESNFKVHRQVFEEKNSQKVFFKNMQTLLPWEAAALEENF